MKEMGINALFGFLAPKEATPAPVSQESGGEKESFKSVLDKTMQSQEKPKANNSNENHQPNNNKAEETDKANANLKDGQNIENAKQVPSEAENGNQSVEKSEMASKAEMADELEKYAMVGVASMNELLEQLNFSDEQTKKLADLLKVSVDELLNMKVKIDTNAENMLKGVMADGTEVDFAKLLNLKENGQFISQKEAANKLKELLNLDDFQADAMVKELKIESLEIVSKIKAGLSDKANALNSKEIGSDKTISSLLEDAKAGTFIRKDASKAEIAKQDFKDALQHNSESSAKKDNGESIDTGVEDNSLQGSKDALRSNVLVANGNKVGISAIDTTEVKIAPTRYANVETTTKVLSQIVDKARMMSFPEHTEARLILTPPQLGTMDIKIVVHDAQVKGHIIVDNSQVKQMIDNNLEHLKNSFAEQGISLDEMSVEVSQRDTGGGNGSNERSSEFSNGSSDIDELFSEFGTGQRAEEENEMRREAQNSSLYVRV